MAVPFKRLGPARSTAVSPPCTAARIRWTAFTPRIVLLHSSLRLCERRKTGAMQQDQDEVLMRSEGGGADVC